MTPTTPGDILRILASDEDFRVREGVGGNAATPVDVLRALATDADWIVRMAVGRNPAAGTVATESVVGSDLHLNDLPVTGLGPARRFRAPALELPVT